MNTYFFIAGLLCFLLGIAHSLLGELLIFKYKRHCGSLVPSKESPDLKERQLRIIWVTWHLASIFGWCIGFIIVQISLDQGELSGDFIGLIIKSIVVSMFLASLLVLIGTKGRHPGWIILLLIMILLIIGS